VQKIAVYQPKVSRKAYGFKIISTIIFYISLLLLTFSDFLNAQFELEKRTVVRLGETSGMTVSFVILVTSALLIDRDFRRLLLGKTGIFYVAVVIFYTLMGWRIFGNDISWIRMDLLTFLWPIGGLALFRIIVQSYRPKVQLMALIAVPTLYIYYAISLQAERMNVLSTAGLTARITDNSAYHYSALLLPLTGIALGVLCRQGWLLRILILGLVAIHLYSLGFIGATRSIVLCILTVLVFSSFGLSYTISEGVLTSKSSLRKPKQFTYLLLIVSIFILSITVFIEFQQMFISFFQNSLIFDRFFDSQNYNSQRNYELRIEEAIDGIKYFQDILEIVFGKGLGSTFPSILGYEINAFHIGVLTFLLKGGIIMFSCVVFTLYIKLPLLFIKSVVKPHRLDYLKRTALLTVLPGVFGWAVLLLLSGGYSPFNFLGVGFAFGTYSHIRKHGLGIFFE